MVYNKAIYEGFVAEPASSDVSAMQFAIEAAQTDQNLFSALIEMDIAEAANEKGIISLSEAQLVAMKEASGEGIIGKIKELIEKFRTAIKNLFDRFFTWLSNVVSNDKAIYKKYSDLISKASWQHCDIKGDALNENAYKNGVAAFERIEKAALASCENTDNLETVKSNIKTMEDNLTILKNLNIVDDSDKRLIEKVNLPAIRNTVSAGYKECNEAAKKNVAKTEEVIRKALSDVEKAQKDAESNDDLARANKAYEGISKTLSLYSQSASLMIRIYNRVIALYRSNFIKLGNWAKQNSVSPKGESTVYDEAQNFLLDMYNEQFCDSLWENA